MTPADFRDLLLTRSAAEIVDQVILANNPGPFLTQEALNSLESKARAVFGLTDEQNLSAIVVGSAKLGFAFLEKQGRDGAGYKPAYRAYQPGASDIDIAVVSQVLYGKIWQDLAGFGANQIYFPWKTDLAAYMLHGWIRPDKFPIASPQRCTDWKNLVHEVSRTDHFRYKRLRCGIFHSRYFLNIYQQRGVIAAQQAERAA